MAKHSALVALVGEDVLAKQEQDMMKWSCFVKGKNGFLYGIPCIARQVLKFDPVDKSMKMIGPHLQEDGEQSWFCGSLAKNGCIYCPPGSPETRHMLKINTLDDTVETIDLQNLTGAHWYSGAVGRDDCIYYLPHSEEFDYIVRLDPNTDTLSSISLRVPQGGFVGTVRGKDGCIYGLPKFLTICDVMRFDPMKPDDISYLDENAGYGSGFLLWRDGEIYAFDPRGIVSMIGSYERDATCCTNFVLGSDGNVYGFNINGTVSKVDTSARTVSLIGKETFVDRSFGQTIMGPDQCIYCPLLFPDHGLLRIDPMTQEQSWHDRPHHGYTNDGPGWFGGALADDGVIYCPPFFANQVLAIDPLAELSVTIKDNMARYPQELGRLFVQRAEYNRESLFDSAARKFGLNRAFALLDECLPSDDEWNEIALDGVPMFMLAASSDVGNGGVGGVLLDVIYHLIRRNVHGLFRD